LITDSAFRRLLSAIAVCSLQQAQSIQYSGQILPHEG
jgi:hypothetical protein